MLPGVLEFVRVFHPMNSSYKVITLLGVGGIEAPLTVIVDPVAEVETPPVPAIVKPVLVPVAIVAEPESAAIVVKFVELFIGIFYPILVAEIVPEHEVKLVPVEFAVR